MTDKSVKKVQSEGFKLPLLLRHSSFLLQWHILCYGMLLLKKKKKHYKRVVEKILCVTYTYIKKKYFWKR